MRLVRSPARAVAVGAYLAIAAACNGAGEGSVRGSVVIPICNVTGPYDLEPDFYGVDRFGDLVTVRIMRGGGPTDYSDNLVISIPNAPEVVRRLDASAERDATGARVVTLPVGPVYTPGVLVHAVLSPNWTCGRRRSTRLAENVGLWVRDGTITFRRMDRGQGAPDVDGVDARTIDVTEFRFSMHDPRPIGSIRRPFGSPAPEGLAADTPVGSAELVGRFRTAFDRGRPSQPFP